LKIGFLHIKNRNHKPKAIVYSTYYLTPHLETELELISLLMRERYETYVVRCFGELETCLANPLHEKSICEICIRKYDEGLKLCGLPKRRIIRLSAVDNRKAIEIPTDFSSVEELKSYEMDGVDFGMAVIGTLISRFGKDHKLDTVKYRLQINKELRMSVNLYHSFLLILEKHAPDVVYVFNGRFSTHRPIVRACEKRGVTFYTHERGGTNNRFVLRVNALPHELEPAKKEILALWDRGDNERIIIGKKFFEDRRKNFDQGWLSFTKYQEIGELPKTFDRSKKNIAIFNSTIEEYESIDCWKNPYYKDETEGMRRLFDSFIGNSGVQFYVRVHPNLAGYDNTQIREIREFEKYPNVTLIMPESRTHSYSLLDSCDCVITYGSTIGVEACYWGRPSILCGRALYEDLDCCDIPKDHADLVRMLSRNPEPKNKEGAYKYGYWELAKGQAYKYFEPTGLFGGKFKGKSLE
jgi:hypothetical protein